jgi:hypothetical protein
MSVGEDDGGWRNRAKRLQPIGAAIDHDAGAAPPDKERAVTAMAARPRLDLAACAEKGQFDLCLP